MSDPNESAGDVYSRGLFPVSPATHDVGLRWLFDLSTLLLLLDCRPGDRVLDLGAGSGFSSEMLARFGYDVVAVDPDGAALANNRRRLTFDASRIAGTVRVTRGVAQHLPCAEGAFDGVFCMNAMHHVDDLPTALGELARVMKPGARMVFSEPGLAHLDQAETKRARAEHGEDDLAFDVLAFLRAALDRQFGEAMLTATLQPPLRLLPVQEIDLYLTGRHPRPHMTAAGVIEELHKHHAFGMIVRAGAKPKTSRYPGVLAGVISTDPLPASVAAGARLVVQARAQNTGDTHWLARPLRHGGYVTFGAKWTDATTGRVVTDVLGRTPLPADVPPGGTTAATLVFDLPPALPPGDYLLKVDLVDEFVCWFSDLPDNAASEHRIRIAG
ncbi:MAG: class I SAM-dependent methyltransferase [Acidobacteriota bacterium]